MCRSTASVIARDEYGDDVTPELCLSGLEFSDAVLSAWSFVVNHELTPGTLEHVLDEGSPAGDCTLCFEGESSETATMGHHNLFDIAAQDSVQKGREA
jgi:hypothetical protein